MSAAYMSSGMSNRITMMSNSGMLSGVRETKECYIRQGWSLLIQAVLYLYINASKLTSAFNFCFMYLAIDALLLPFIRLVMLIDIVKNKIITIHHF